MFLGEFFQYLPLSTWPGPRSSLRPTHVLYQFALSIQKKPPIRVRHLGDIGIGRVANLEIGQLANSGWQESLRGSSH